MIGVAAISGCATQPQPRPLSIPAPPYQAMDQYQPNCYYAREEIPVLEQKVTEYQTYHQDHAITDADLKYYGKLKNSLWGLRSCGSKQS